MYVMDGTRQRNGGRHVLYCVFTAQMFKPSYMKVIHQVRLFTFELYFLALQLTEYGWHTKAIAMVMVESRDTNLLARKLLGGNLRLKSGAIPVSVM
jgi:hypothetical protein